jgi:hypothetical protein
MQASSLPSSPNATSTRSFIFCRSFSRQPSCPSALTASPSGSPFPLSFYNRKSECTMDVGSGCSLASISAKFNESKTRSDRSVARSGTYNMTSMYLSFMGFREESKTIVVCCHRGSDLGATYRNGRSGFFLNRGSRNRNPFLPTVSSVVQRSALQ